MASIALQVMDLAVQVMDLAVCVIKEPFESQWGGRDTLYSKRLRGATAYDSLVEKCVARYSAFAGFASFAPVTAFMEKKTFSMPKEGSLLSLFYSA